MTHDVEQVFICLLAMYRKIFFFGEILGSYFGGLCILDILLQWMGFAF